MSIKSMRQFAEDLKQMKGYIAVSAALFFIGIAVGSGSGMLQRFLQSQIEPLAGMAEQLDQLENTQLWLFLFIFFNNFLKSAAVVFLGALFGLIPAYFLLVNGMVLGYVIRMMSVSGMNSVDLIIRGLLPHGLLELTAVIIAAAYGIKFGVLVSRSLAGLLRGRSTRADLRGFNQMVKRLMGFLFLALLAAAFIESTVTYFLVRG